MMTYLGGVLCSYFSLAVMLFQFFRAGEFTPSTAAVLCLLVCGVMLLLWHTWKMFSSALASMAGRRSLHVPTFEELSGPLQPSRN